MLNELYLSETNWNWDFTLNNVGFIKQIIVNDLS